MSNRFESAKQRLESRAESKTLRRQEQQVAKAALQRETLLDSGRLSLPSGMGKLAIIVSNRPSYNDMPLYESYEAQEKFISNQPKGFLEEAERIKALREQDHQQVVIRRRAVPLDMKMDFADPEVTDIILIGHGSVNSIWSDGGTKYFNWYDAARATDNLKQGKVEQMMCGHFPLKYSVPLGTFAVSKLSNVTAALGERISIPDGTPREHLFAPVYNDIEPVMDQITTLNDEYRLPGQGIKREPTA